MRLPWRAPSDEIDEEIRTHIRLAVAERIARGEDPRLAELAVRREFGNLTHVAELTREMRMGPWRYAADAAQDLRIALRRMLRTPALTTGIVATIALGLGAAAAIFIASGAALLAPLPYRDAGRLVHVWELRAGTEERSPTSYPTLLDWRSQAGILSAVEGYDPANVTVGLDDEARMLRGAGVTVGFFRLLGVSPSRGRDFLPEEDAITGANVVLVSAELARTLGAEEPLGWTITINGASHTVVGVLPAAFHFALLQDADIFVPLAVDGDRRVDRTQRTIHVIGRLEGNTTPEDAQAGLAALMSRLANEHPDALAGRTVAALPLRDALLGNMRPILAGLLAAVVLLLAIMGANLALLMLTRYVERTPELAMRSALGASRARLLRQLLVESLAPSLAGAALAVVIGHLTVRALIRAIPDSVGIGMPYLVDAGIDTQVIVVILAMATSLAVAFGLGPAQLLAREWDRVRHVRAGQTRGIRRSSRILVGVQLALAVVLLASSALLVASFRNLVHRETGFVDPDGLVTARVPLSGPRYDEPVAQRTFYESLLERASVMPGVRSASLVDEVPGGGGGATTFESVERPLPPSVRPRAALRIVGGPYFASMGIPVVAGRAFDSRDRSDSPLVAVVSEGLADLLASDGPTVGRKLRLSNTGADEWDVIGVVGDVQVSALDADRPPVIYLYHLQRAENRLTLVLRTDLEPASIAAQVRSIVGSLDASVPAYDVATLGRRLSDSRAVFSRRFPMILCGVFAAAALALTLVAFYAMCTHEVSTRTREFGIRLALGESPGSVRSHVITDALRTVAAGVLAGGLAAVLVARTVDAMLFGISPTDWRVHAAVAAGVLVSALAATALPAVRAGSVNPAVVLRPE